MSNSARNGKYIPPHLRRRAGDASSNEQTKNSPHSKPKRNNNHPKADAGNSSLWRAAKAETRNIGDGRRNRRWSKDKEQQQDQLPAKVFLRAFTRICCVNLRRRTDRWKDFISQLHKSFDDEYNSDYGKHLILNRVERFDAVDGNALVAEKSQIDAASNDLHFIFDGDYSSDNNYNERDNHRTQTPQQQPVLQLDWDATQNSMYDKHIQPPMNKRLSPGEVGCAMSHIRLWQQLASSDDPNSTMLILEDDAIFYRGSNSNHNNNRAERGGRGNRNTNNYNKNRRYRGGPNQQQYHRYENNNPTQDARYNADKSNDISCPPFLVAFAALWEQIPEDWGILYLGFSDRGERVEVGSKADDVHHNQQQHIHIDVFQPTYGFHTHAYAIKRSAARALLSHLPVVGPVDVWLADNKWCNLPVYCSVVANEGWRNTGAWLISQNRRRQPVHKNAQGSDIPMSARRKGQGQGRGTDSNVDENNNDLRLPVANNPTPTCIAIIVPFRDIHPAQKRSEHLKQFIPHMKEFCNKLIANGSIYDYHVYIVNQSDDGRKFNRGKLLNIGFQMARNSDKKHDVFIFHDVDLLPNNDLGRWYAMHPQTPIHIARVWDRYSNNPKYFGGVVSFSSSDYERINGYPNTFWGWGGEDDEMQKRLEKLRIKWIYPDRRSGSFTDLEQMSIKQKLDFLRENKVWKCMVKWENLDEHDATWKMNGLSDLNFTLMSKTSLEGLGDSNAIQITVDVKLNDNHWGNAHSGIHHLEAS